ncbi:MAG: amidohydrolase [Gammaproteobacteria bacterium]|nr:amidohydrolase [Gammaproteobacteria bacterium]MBK7168087.1 amidohydrolase [Gammaproteobacteria bacterium]MBK7519155.1 amidohydrolase [Gammaproteobacteria bacterium]
MSRVTIISSDCHAGALPVTYNEYMPRRYHEAANAWWIGYAREMYARAGTFFDQEAVETYAEQVGEGGGRMRAFSDPGTRLSDEDVLGMLSDASSPFAPRRGEFDATVRIRELDADGIAGEVIFPQMAPFGAGLMQYRFPVTPEQSFVGCQAYNRWLADLCRANPQRHAGVALIDVEDIDASVREIRAAREMGLWGGVLLPTSTGAHPFYHHPRYEPIWAVCEELDMPLQSHSGWSPDYGDVPSATAMFISEVDMFAQRPFTALLWSGVFERYPRIRYMLTETGVGWVVEKLRVLEFKAANPMFRHFRKGLSLSPSEYFARNCFVGASFMPEHEGRFRHQIGVDRLMWGSDYPHLEGTWPNTMKALNATFGEYPEDEIRAILGLNAARAYGFDLAALQPIADRIGPSIAAIRSGR